MFKSRKTGYEATEGDGATLDDLSRKLSTDLRKHVRKLDMHKPYGKEWNTMVDSLIHVANIAMMEHRLPRNGADESTLWEGDDLTVRFLLEEGKLNLCLRLLVEFFKAKQAMSESSFTEAATVCGLPDAEMMRGRSIAFEQSLGTLLRCALMHVEAVQTTDLPLLLEHCSDALKYGTSGAADAYTVESAQEQVVFYYLTSVAERMDVQQAGLDESRVMPLIAQGNLVPLTVKALDAHHAALKPDVQLAAATFLAICFDAEAYESPSQKAVFTPPETIAQIKSFKVNFLDAHVADREKRKRLRPLLDVVERAAR